MNEDLIFIIGTNLEREGLSHSEIDDYFLAHYGVKGMKWGVRRAHRKNMRALNKASRQRDREKNAAEIQRARDRFQSGKAREDYKKAKEKYKRDKQVIGKREAKKALQKVKDKNYRDYQKSQEFKDKGEVGKYIAATLAVATVSAVLSTPR